MPSSMIWIKVASATKFSSNSDGTEKAWPLAVQDWGLRVEECLYCILPLDRSSTAAKVGARHDEGPTGDSNYFATQSTPITVATMTTVPKAIRGQTTADVTLLPYFQPVVLVASTGASLESVTADVYVGGRL